MSLCACSSSSCCLSCCRNRPLASPSFAIDAFASADGPWAGSAAGEADDGSNPACMKLEVCPAEYERERERSPGGGGGPIDPTLLEAATAAAAAAQPSVAIVPE